MSYNGTTDPIVLIHDKKNEVSTVILSLIGGVSLMAVVTRLLYRYADFKKTPWYALATVWLNWFAAVCLVLLIPVDVSSSIHEDCLQQLVNTTYTNQTHGIFHTNETTTITIVDGCDEPWVHVSREGLIIIWKIIYWFTFIMCWAVVPLMQSYVVAAHFHWYQRVLRAFFENLVLYGVGLVVGIGLAIWLILTEKLDEAGLIGIAMAASNAYGLLIVILLLGYGLTELPRKIWRKANRQATMRYYQFHAFLYMESYQEAKKELETTLKLVKKYDESIPETDPMRKYFRVILSKVPMEYKDIPKGAGDVKTTYKDYVTLHSRLINATHEVLATRCLYEDLLRRAFNLEDVMKAKENRTKVVEWTFKKKKVNALTPYMSKIEWYWKVFAEPWALRLGCGICILMGIIIVWSETLFSVKKVKLSLLYWIVQGPKSPPFVLLWFLVFAPMAYISLCAYWSLFRLRIFKYYRLLPHHNSDANSLLFNAYYLSRIIAPMAYNFLLLINDNVSSFSTVMGVADVTPLLGSFFNVYFPIVLILFCIANAFNFYTRFVEFFSQAVSCCLKVKVNNFEFDDDFYDERLDKGKEIIAQEKEFKISRNALSLDLGIDLLKYTPKKAEKQTSSKWSARLAGMLSSKSKPKSTDSLELVERGRV